MSYTKFDMLEITGVLTCTAMFVVEGRPWYKASLAVSVYFKVFLRYSYTPHFKFVF